MDRDENNLDLVENLSKDSPVVIFDMYFEVSSAFASWNWKSSSFPALR